MERYLAFFFFFLFFLFFFSQGVFFCHWEALILRFAFFSSSPTP